jgi:hypothetical protein
MTFRHRRAPSLPEALGRIPLPRLGLGLPKLPAVAALELGAPPQLWREARAALEAAALLRDAVFRGDGVEHGGGLPVLLIPG